MINKLTYQFKDIKEAKALLSQLTQTSAREYILQETKEFEKQLEEVIGEMEKHQSTKTRLIRLGTT